MSAKRKKERKKSRQKKSRVSKKKVAPAKKKVTPAKKQSRQQKKSRWKKKVRKCAPEYAVRTHVGCCTHTCMILNAHMYDAVRTHVWCCTHTCMTLYSHMYDAVRTHVWCCTHTCMMLYAHVWCCTHTCMMLYAHMYDTYRAPYNLAYLSGFDLEYKRWLIRKAGKNPTKKKTIVQPIKNSLAMKNRCYVRGCCCCWSYLLTLIIWLFVHSDYVLLLFLLD